MEGSKLKYRWHFYGIESVLDMSGVAKLPKLLEQNPTVTVCEKLTGDILCLSSKGWIGTDTRILIENVFVAKLSRESYQKQSLESLKPIFCKLALIAKELQTLLSDVDLQVVLYGEWLRLDTRFNYKSRGLFPRQFRAFGLGIIPGPGKEVDQLKLGSQFDWNLTFCNEWGEPYYLVNLNCVLAEFLTSRKIKIVPVYGEFSLQRAFLDPDIFRDLFESRVRGVVLSWSEGILKWRSRHSFDVVHQDLALIALEKILDGKFPLIYKNLELVAFPFLGNLDTVCILNELYAGAKNLLPTLEDFMQDTKDKNRVARVYHNRIIHVMRAQCQEPTCYLTYFVKIKEQRHYWVFNYYREEHYLDHFPSWYK